VGRIGEGLEKKMGRVVEGCGEFRGVKRER
jgi:hypothetical protein